MHPVLHTLLQLDKKLFLFFNYAIANPVFDTVFPVITNGTFWVIPGIIAALAFLYFQRKKALIVMCLMLVTVSVSDPVCNQIIKPQFHRLRPCDGRVSIDNGRFLLGRKNSESFPSSHAMNMFGQAMLLTLLYRRKRVWITAFVFAAIIGFSRIYVGVHYPLDVLAGAVFGACIGLLRILKYSLVLRKFNPSWLRFT